MDKYIIINNLIVSKKRWVRIKKAEIDSDTLHFFKENPIIFRNEKYTSFESFLDKLEQIKIPDEKSYTKILDELNEAFSKNTTFNEEFLIKLRNLKTKEELISFFHGIKIKDGKICLPLDFNEDASNKIILETYTSKNDKIEQVNHTHKKVVFDKLENKSNIFSNVWSYVTSMNKKLKKTSTNKELITDVIINKKDESDYEYVQEYVSIGIPGFDELITHGIPKGSSVLLCGGAGTGKTTFSLQLLNYLSTQKKKCLYLTFEEDVSKLKNHMKGYGWNPKKLEDEGYLKIKKSDSFEVSRSVEALLAKASGELIIDIDEVNGLIPEGFTPDIIVLDSLSAVSAAFLGKEEGYRIYIEQLFSMFKKIGATSFLISEVEENTNKYTRTGIEEFLADAVIVFYSLRQKSVRVTAIEIIKVRGTPHQKKIVPFKLIPGQGMTIFPKEDPFID